MSFALRYKITYNLFKKLLHISAAMVYYAVYRSDASYEYRQILRYTGKGGDTADAVPREKTTIIL